MSLTTKHDNRDIWVYACIGTLHLHVHKKQTSIIVRFVTPIQQWIAFCLMLMWEWCNYVTWVFSFGRIHKNKQLLDWPFTRLLLESLYKKNEQLLASKRSWTLDRAIANPFLVNARRISNCSKGEPDLLLLTIHCSYLRMCSHGKQQVLVKAKGYVYVFEQLLGLWLDILLIEQLLDLLLG